jgi:hypothetical protein
LRRFPLLACGLTPQSHFDTRLFLLS